MLPTEEQYKKLQNGYPGFFKREYEDLKQEYEALRRPFSVTANVPYTDVWDFPTVQYYPGKHPCEKPLDMHRHVITASSKPGGVVLDCFGGSCKVADVCRELGREYVIIEADEQYVKAATARLATRETTLESFGVPAAYL